VIEIPVFEMPTTYTVSVVPADDIHASTFDITVEHRGRGLWAVCWFGRCLTADGDWDFEPSPSGREDDWLAAHRFDLQTALRLAREAAPNIRVNGLTAREVAARNGATT
jgi:hypothetical protein